MPTTMRNNNSAIEAVVDRVAVMRYQEETSYALKSYLPSDSSQNLNVAWREKICHWSYNVVDHFDLSREVVAISLSLFDRFLATRNNECNGNLALLTSLTTLHLAIKIHDSKKIRISTLANLSRGQFGASDIEDMEWRVLRDLKWKVHPPTAYSFVYQILLFLPQEASSSVRKEIFELSRYLTELTVCDSYFVDANQSCIAFAAILNVLEDIPYNRLSAGIRECFLRDLGSKASLHYGSPDVAVARQRITAMFASDSMLENKLELIDSQGSVGSGRSSSVESLGRSFRRARANSGDSKGSASRCSPSSRRRIAVASPSNHQQRRMQSSPIVAKP